MKRLGRNFIAAAVTCALVMGLAGCRKEGPAERAGKEIDKAGEKLKDAIKDFKK